VCAHAALFDTFFALFCMILAASAFFAKVFKELEWGAFL
jgi:hypothetical protein